MMKLISGRYNLILRRDLHYTDRNGTDIYTKCVPFHIIKPLYFLNTGEYWITDHKK